MISRYKFLYGVLRRASSQVLLNPRSIRLPERVSFYSSNIDPTLPTGETPLKAHITLTHNEFIPAGGEIDFLEKSIEAAKTTDQILNVIERHAVIMDHDHLLGCIKKLADLPQGGIFSESLADSDAFQTALDTIAHRVELFDGEELVELILCLNKLQVPSKAPVIEEICSELRFNLNDRSLTLGRLPQLIQILGKSPTPSVNNLIRTLHVAIQFRIRQELDVEDKDTCTRFFKHILIHETDKATVDFIAEATLRHCHSFSYHTAATVLFSSNFYLDRSPKARLQSSKVKEVLTVCLKIASENMDSMSDIQLKRTAIGVTGWRIGTDEFFAAIWRKASNWSSEVLQNLLKGSLLNDFMSLPVANRIVARYLNQHDEFASLRIKEGDLCAMATAIATSAVHTAPGSDENQQALKAARLLMDFVVERGNFFQGDSTMDLANFLTQMCICGIYSWPHLDKVFESKSQERNSSSYAYLATLKFLEEMLAYKLKDSSKYACIPENSILLLTTINIRFSRTSIKSIGNCISSFAKCSNDKSIGIRVEVSGLKIDFLVAFGRDGIPLYVPGALRRLVSLEELPPESKVVAIVFDPKARFSSGLTKPACEWKMKRLRDEGFCPVVFPDVPADGPAEANLAAMIQKALREGPVYRKHETSGNVIKKFRK